MVADGSYVVYHYSDGSLEYEEHFNATGTLQEVLKYFYDAAGNVEYLLYKNDSFSTAGAYDLYYYVRNATGDITDLFQVREQSGSSTTVVNRLAAHYEYDPYGNILSVDTYNNDNIGNINPIRYKGYYYDLQTGWYQLTSRFYDSEVGRFLNADSQINIGIAETNLYAYCNNNPVNMMDPSGHSPISKALAGVGKVVAKVVVAAVKKPHNDLPRTGKPNSRVSTPDGMKEREYGPDGRAKKDTEYGHPHHHPELGTPHHHDWEWDDKGNSKRGPAYSVNDISTALLGAGLVTVCAVGVIVIAADDVSGIGVADDFLLAPLCAGAGEGIVIISGV